MRTIALPQNTVYVPAGENEGTIVIEPCYPGYGVTIGNSLRRVLLSSLPGAAVIGAKIEGANHEFMSLPNIKEDILELIMNLKKIRLKVHTDEIVKLELEEHGEKTVCAGDINKNSQVEIVNPELKIAKITELAGNLKMEIFASQGRGYEMVENRPMRQKEIGYIEIDSIFSPVLSVGINIDNVRVGKMTNWDKLSLQIKTDGTITAEEAFGQAVEILLEQFRSISLKKSDDSGKEDLAEQDDPKQAREKEASKDEAKVDEGAGEDKDIDKVILDNRQVMETAKEKKKRGRPKKRAEEK